MNTTVTTDEGVRDYGRRAITSVDSAASSNAMASTPPMSTTHHGLHPPWVSNLHAFVSLTTRFQLLSNFWSLKVNNFSFTFSQNTKKVGPFDRATLTNPRTKNQECPTENQNPTPAFTTEQYLASSVASTLHSSASLSLNSSELVGAC